MFPKLLSKLFRKKLTLSGSIALLGVGSGRGGCRILVSFSVVVFVTRKGWRISFSLRVAVAVILGAAGFPQDGRFGGPEGLEGSSFGDTAGSED